MNLLVIGASRGVGAHLTRLALTQGHRVTAFSRQPDKLGQPHERLLPCAGDFHDAAALDRAMPGQQAVVITAGLPSMGAYQHQPEFFSHGTRLTIDAMRKHRVPRLIVLSAFGVGDSWPLMNIAGKLFVRLFLSLPYADHDRQEVLTRNSSLDWTIARPTRLSNDPARGQFVREPSLRKVPSSISREDVAIFLLEAATSNQWLNKTVQLGG